MLNYANLVAQGRAKGYGQPWSPEELELLIAIEKKGVSRTLAADYIRNGIKSLEDYEQAVKKDFKPLTVDEAKEEAVKAIEAKGQVAIKAKAKTK